MGRSAAAVRTRAILVAAAVSQPCLAARAQVVGRAPTAPVKAPTAAVGQTASLAVPEGLALSPDALLPPPLIGPAMAAAVEAQSAPAEPGFAAFSKAFSEDLRPAVERAVEPGAPAAEAFSAGQRLSDFMSGERDLARPLRLDPGMPGLVRRDLMRLQGVVHGIDLRRAEVYRGLPAPLRERQRGFFGWLKRQLDRDGQLPFFELTEHIKHYGGYLGWSGVSLVHKIRNSRQAERLATLAHESYHAYARWRELPVMEQGRHAQERDAAVAELLLWDRMDLQSRGRIRPDPRTEGFLRFFRRGDIEGIQAYVDRVYGKEDAADSEPAQRELLRRQLEGRIERIRRLQEEYRRRPPTRDNRDAEALLDRRANALRRHLLYVVVNHVSLGLGRRSP